MFELGDDSIIIVATVARPLHALHNTCRHAACESATSAIRVPCGTSPAPPAACGGSSRSPAGLAAVGGRGGSSGRATSDGWVCPYHQWSYGLDGALLGCGGSGGARSTRPLFGLQRAAVAENGGLIFVWARPGAVRPLGDAELGARALAPSQEPGRARVAHVIEYRVAANWKLIWQNNRECWHCRAGHPEYVRANFDIAPADAGPLALARAHERADARGSAGDGRGAAGAGRDEPPSRGSTPSSRGPLVGREPHSVAPGLRHGGARRRPAAPLMGDYPGYDVGTLLRARTAPNFWCHANARTIPCCCLPAGPDYTRITVSWLVDGDAVEGRDYRLDRLLPFWPITSEQDDQLEVLVDAGGANVAVLEGEAPVGQMALEGESLKRSRRARSVTLASLGITLVTCCPGISMR